MARRISQVSRKVVKKSQPDTYCKANDIRKCSSSVKPFYAFISCKSIKGNGCWRMSYFVFVSSYLPKSYMSSIPCGAVESFLNISASWATLRGDMLFNACRWMGIGCSSPRVFLFSTSVSRTGESLHIPVISGGDLLLSFIWGQGCSKNKVLNLCKRHFCDGLCSLGLCHFT